MLLALAVSPLGGCLIPTPYGSDVDQRQLNDAAIRSLPAPASPERFRFVALSDSHDAYDELQQAVIAINRIPDVEFVVHAGDISEYGLAQEYEWTARALAGLRVPAFVVIGNHDAISNGKAVYRNLYGPFDFSFRFGAYKFVCFNSNALEFDGAAPDRAWLEAELSELQGARSAVLVTHQNPAAPDGPAGATDAAFYERLLENHPVALIVHGHLDERVLATWHRAPNLQLGTFSKTGRFSVIGISGAEVRVESCDASGCLPEESFDTGASADEAAR